MTSEPDFEPDFYKNQIDLMCERYQLIFKKWKINWDKFYEEVRRKLKYRQYWIWVYLCGIETFIQKENKNKNSNSKNILEKLEKESNFRIQKISGPTLRTEGYIDSL